MPRSSPPALCCYRPVQARVAGHTWWRPNTPSLTLSPAFEALQGPLRHSTGPAGGAEACLKRAGAGATAGGLGEKVGLGSRLTPGHGLARGCATWRASISSPPCPELAACLDL